MGGGDRTVREREEPRLLGLCPEQHHLLRWVSLKVGGVGGRRLGDKGQAWCFGHGKFRTPVSHFQLEMSSGHLGMCHQELS